MELEIMFQIVLHYIKKPLGGCIISKCKTEDNQNTYESLFDTRTSFPEANKKNKTEFDFKALNLAVFV